MKRSDALATHRNIASSKLLFIQISLITFSLFIMIKSETDRIIEKIKKKILILLQRTEEQ